MDINKFNENQYSDNMNGLLVILLLLVLVKCNKTEQKCEALSNALQEEYIINKDIKTITNDSEMDPDYVKKNRIKTNIEKAKIKMLIKELQSSIKPNINLEEMNEQSIEPLEQEKSEGLVKEEIVKEELVKEEIVKEELVKEEIVKEEVVKEELVKEELEEREKASLEKSNKKGSEKMRRLRKGFDRNPIMPMEIILKQLVGENVTFSTAARSNRFIANATLLSVKDGIVHMDIYNSVLSIPIGEIVGVESNLINSIELQPLVEISRSEFYEYKEWSLRNLFSTMIGEKISIETTGSGSFNNISDKLVTNVGQGIVVLDNTMAISLSKIILVERR